VLLVFAALFIVWEAASHLQNPHEIEHQGLAILTIFVSMGVSYWAYRHNAGAARDTESSAIHVNALHFLADGVASAGVLFGLVLIYFTGWLWVDPAIGVLVALYIFAISMKQIRGSIEDLSDSMLPAAEVDRIRAILGEFQTRMIEAHDLRTRRGGAHRHIDFHLVLCGHLSVRRSHELCDEMEGALMTEFPRSSVTIHVEPCQHENVDCLQECPYRAQPQPGDLARSEEVMP
jgi:cation diffusion facilitator family transporter